MNNRSITTGLVIFFGFLLVIATQLVFPPCASMITTATGMQVPMKCHWSAQMAMSLGGLIMFEGFFMGIMKSTFARMGISLVVMATSVLTLLVPLSLIGVCGGSMMPCRAAMLPAVTVVSVLLFGVSIGNVWYLHSHQEAPAVVRP